MAPHAETEEAHPPNVDCHCTDCGEFRIPYDSLWELFEKPRVTDGLSGGIADSLWDAWTHTKDAWERHQKHFKHEFVPKERAGAQHDGFQERTRAERPAEPKPQKPPEPTYTRAPQPTPQQHGTDSSGQSYWHNGRFYGKFVVCDHCHAHSLKCSEASVCDQCELHGQPCIHRECGYNDFKEKCPNEECRYAHRRDLPPKGRNDPSWIILPGKLKGYRESGFRLPILLDGLTKMNSVERIRLLQPLQTQSINAANAAAASRKSLSTYRHDCDCPSEDDDEDFTDCDEAPPIPDPRCRVCDTTITIFWAVTPCNTRTCLDCALCKCLINTGPRCDCREDKCAYLVTRSSVMEWEDVPQRYQVSRNHDIYAEAKWLRDHVIGALDRKRNAVYR